MSVLKIRDEDGNFMPVLVLNGKDGKGFTVIEAPEGEVAPTSIFEMAEGIYWLKGKFNYYPNYADYNHTINFEREVIACVTKSEGAEDFYGSPVYWERKHLWYFDATANNNTGSQVIITVKYNGEDDVYDNSFNYTPNKYLERSSFKQREIDDLFYSRLADEEGRTEFYPTLGVMADYVNSIIIKALTRTVTINLQASEWVQDGDMFAQAIEIPNITPYSKVDLQPTAEQLVIFHEKDLAFVTENENGVVTVFCIGQKPTNDYIMQATITEVEKDE